ncbi:MAG: class I SAM-dependent methyltransferase [Betaproteobacteria bacterium]|nr:class I SAM-dependent methyltransferase [Betaproteobacteria bacterium]
MRLTKFVLAVLCFAAAATAAAQEERTGGPYVPTPQSVVDEMLKLAGVREEDFVVDLGSGDGRIVLTAARRFQARGMGVDIDGELVDQSNAAAQREGLDHLVQFDQRDVLQTDIGEASVLTLYLLPNMMASLRSKILAELKPGSRVVSHDFEFGEWQPDRKVTIDAPDKYGPGGTWTSNVMLWVVPARVEGVWRIALSGNSDKLYTVTLKQKFQKLEGEARQGGRRVEIRDMHLEGNRIRFVLQPGAPRAAPREFRGVINGDQIGGEVTIAQATANWTAKRVVTSARKR